MRHNLCFSFQSTEIQFHNFDGVCPLFIHPAAGWTVFCIRLQQWYGFVATWKQCLSDACKLCCAYTVCCSSEYRGPWLAKQFWKEDSCASKLQVSAWGSDPGHLSNVNRFLCDFQTLFCYLVTLILQNRLKQTQKSRKGGANLTFVYCCELIEALPRDSNKGM